MHYLVTGGAGFIGSHLCEQLIRKGHTLLCLDNFNDYYSPKIKHQNLASIKNHERFQLIEGDILDWPLLEHLFQDQSFDGVVHLAARAGVRPSIQHPRLYQKVNIEGTVNMLEICAKTQVPKFVLASTSSVYGNNDKVPFHEDDPVDHPISPYAATKKACELIAHTYHVIYNLPVTCLRFFTVYGPRQRPDMAIHKFTQLIDAGESVPFFGDGKTKRDYTYIDDIIDGVIRAIEHCKGYRVYNLGESQTIELAALIKLLEKTVGKEAKINRMPLQPGDVLKTYADITRAREEIGYNPQVSIEKGVERFVSWYRKKMEGNG
ncbi:GDP-mannose 4,6-dehydratase [bacterium]|nr:GDP-mannose 4,6-dehydratase [bacterium]